MTHDIDRTRLAAKAQWTIAAVRELEALAIAAATQHERQLDMLREELNKSNNAAVANAEAEADYLADLDGDLRQAVAELIDSIRPVKLSAAYLADNANPTAAIVVVAEALRELTGQVLEGNPLMDDLVKAREFGEQFFALFETITKTCTAAGMPFCEPEDVPAWLAANLKPKARRKAKPAHVEDDQAVDADPLASSQLSILDEVSDA
jgi:2',3'-cyclic-nucleotide 2'-phosphodiesterase (5'-nucleotidase family)